ncbi:metalloprotease [Clostridium botulinum]|uniref:Metalloprotease n=1 Tax=Clostridium botulinum C/D str. DC5 TaxID=1443128 RepID=A0A0A0IC50_CLOBO|nr:M50 family metallopeptidase [Clostridium botulinum]KEI01001.1 metalloprotease [Clostridium botulinum C/D str. BKT75002]KEI11167.1 metalloprotease [Clostridium botulinum C/D str. BKT2873]KGM94021.1 metalloprotease [Clostridium botulinum D str. CCUG 7971]KGM99029.1 metalloprotease [Clostridium botulinum C/D str. DC5]KOC47374.1 metalloprotease [Clostridium botulinum]
MKIEKEKQLIIKISKLSIPYILILVIIGFKGKLLISFVLVFMHEIVHYITAKRLGFKGFGIEILPIGAVLKLRDLDEADPKEDLIISLSGPLFNLIFAMISYLLNIKFSNEYLQLLYISNLALGAFNLIPALPLDGGRILRDILAFKTFYKRANKITVNVSLVIGSLISAYFLILIALGFKNVSIGIIGFLIIVTSYKEKERIVYLIMGDIIKKRCKFITRGYIENKSISVYYKKNLLDALGVVDKNKYNLFTVLNDDMKVINIIYEEELIRALKIYGNISIEDYLNTVDEIDKLAKMAIDEWQDWKDECNKEV